MPANWGPAGNCQRARIESSDSELSDARDVPRQDIHLQVAPPRRMAQGRRKPRGRYARPQQNEVSLTAVIANP